MGADNETVTWQLLGRQLAHKILLSSIEERYLNYVQTACAVLGVVGAATAAKRHIIYPHARPVDVMYKQLRAASGPLLHPIVKFKQNPWNHLGRKRAVILQGRAQEGKTTLLRTSIPWQYTWHVWGWRGFYLNGAESYQTASFDNWVTLQMFGTVSSAGAEVKRSLSEFRRSQWIRLLMEACWIRALEPRPVYIVVDRFEELMRKYPEEALSWADAMTNLHTSNNLARLIFVVNSDAGAQSLLNLSGRRRFTRIVLAPLADDELPALSLLDQDLFKQCQNNIGLYKIVSHDLATGGLAREEVSKFIRTTLNKRRLDFNVPYPYRYDQSWLEVSLGEAKLRLCSSLEALLFASHASISRQNATDVHTIMRIVEGTVMRLDWTQLLLTSRKEWGRMLSNDGVAYIHLESLSRTDAKVVAKHIKRVLGHPIGKNDWTPRT